MNKNFIKILFCWFLFFSAFGGKQRGAAQDFHLSQYETTTFYLNPALTGKFSGYHRAHIHYRNQWASLGIKPYITTAVSYDRPYKNNIGLGALVLNDRAGSGNYNVITILFSAAYDADVIKEKPHRISAGLQIGLTEKSVNMDKLFFHNQYSTSGGGKFNTSVPSGEEFLFNNNNIFLPDLNAGLLYFYSSPGARFNPYAGFAVFHIIEPNESFYEIQNNLPRRYTLHGGIKINVTEKLQVTPKFLTMRQVNARETLFGVTGNYYLEPSGTWLILGASYRNEDAAIAEAGVKYGKFIYRFSYDINVSSLQRYSRQQGGFEFSITYVTGKILSGPTPQCLRM